MLAAVPDVPADVAAGIRGGRGPAVAPGAVGRPLEAIAYPGDALRVIEEPP